jgi:dolichol kinase
MAAVAPREAARRMTHAGVGLLSLSLRWLPWWGAVLCCVGGIGMNFLVLPRVAPKIFRPDEHALSGVRAYPVAVLLLVFLFPLRIAAAAWAILAVGDSMAALVGRTWGSVKCPWNRDKSIQGMLAFAIFGAAAGAIALGFVIGRPNPTFGLFAELDSFLRHWNGPVPLEVFPKDYPGTAQIALTAGAAGAVGAFVESLPSRIDDNFRVALMSGAVLLLMDPLNGATLVSR